MSEVEVRQEIARYVVGERTAEQLEHLLPDGWELDEAAEPGLRDLVLRVMGHLAEYMAGDIGGGELRNRLLPYAGSIVTITYSSTSGAVQLATPQTAQAFVAGTALLAGSG